MANKNLRPVKITARDGCQVLNVGNMEIWDGGELSLVRDTMTRLVEEEDCRSLGVDMSHVKYVPSGFFGLLYDWYEKGVCIRVFGPLSQQVKRMLWFTKFFHCIGNNCHELRPDFEDDDGEQDSEKSGATSDNGFGPPVTSPANQTPTSG